MSMSNILANSIIGRAILIMKEKTPGLRNQFMTSMNG